MGCKKLLTVSCKKVLTVQCKKVLTVPCKKLLTMWLQNHLTTHKQFFYWQRILRREAYEASQNPSLPAVTETGHLSAVQKSVSFAEIKLPAVLPDASSVFHPDLVIRKGKLVLEISNSASAELLSRIGGILRAE